MRTKRGVAVLALGCAAAMTLAACGSKGSSSDKSKPATGGATLNACMVLDTGGIDDKSFNETSYAGMTAAAKANPNIKISYIPSNSGNDYTPNLTTEVGKKCDPIIAVGGLMADNVKAIAAANPSVHFAEVDSPSTGSNMYGMQFNTAQGAFLGGVLAAGSSKTGVVGTWGGAKIGPVTIYMDGFWEGVQYYNRIAGKSVKVLGWDETNQNGGTFVPGNNPFGDPNDGKSISQSMINQGADVLFPVAGGSGLGAGAAAAASGGKVKVLWVDTDGCESAAQYCSVFLGSVTKGLSQAVQAYLGQASKGTYPTGNYIGTLSNDGTALVLGSTLGSTVPSSLNDMIAKAKSGIEGGSIKITSPSQPTS